MGNGAVEPKRRGIGWKAAWWALVVFGGVSSVLGIFLLVGDDDEYVGLGGDLAWRAGEVSTAWAIGLLIGGVVLLGGAVAMAIAGRRMGPVEITPLQELLLHTGFFVVVNTYLWIQDVAIGTGLDYAYLVTLTWGIGLAIHALHVYRGTKAVAEPEPASIEQRELQHH